MNRRGTGADGKGGQILLQHSCYWSKAAQADCLRWWWVIVITNAGKLGAKGHCGIEADEGMKNLQAVAARSKVC